MIGDRRPSWRGTLVDGLHRLPPAVHRLLPAEQRTDLRHRLGRYRAWEGGVDLTPPPPHSGEATGPPDFVGIGVTLAGSERWYRLIAEHPGVSARPDLPAARHFLSHFATAAFGPDQVARYHDWFPRRSGTTTGEWTPSYIGLPWVAALLGRAAPEARLLLMVRNPIERIRAGLAQSAGGPGSQVGTRIAEAVERGFYGAQLRQVLEHFSAGQLLVLQYERCATDPDGQLAATYRFLGLDDSYRPTRGVPPPARDPAESPMLDPDAVDRLVGVYAEDVAELVSAVPSLDLSLWPEFARR